MNRVAVAAAAKTFARWLAILSMVDVVLGVAWAELKGRTVATSITEAFFISGGIIFVGAAFSGGGVRGRRSALAAGHESPPEMPFTAVLIGIALIGVGVLTIVL